MRNWIPVNLNNTLQWKSDIAASVDMYNEWFLLFAPKAFRDARISTTKKVEDALLITNNLVDFHPAILRAHPEILPTLRMSTCPPIATDRLIGLAGVPSSFVKSMEQDRRLPKRMSVHEADVLLSKISAIIEKMADPDIFVWLKRQNPPTGLELHRAATIIADRLCGSVANPIIRNAQERRQLAAIKDWLEVRGYRQLSSSEGIKFNLMPPGTFSFRMNIRVTLVDGLRSVNIPIDAVIKPKTASKESMPLLIEAKSAGDFTNTNKRRKEEAVKMTQLRSAYGEDVRFNLFLCGYFDSGYLGYEAAEGIDWIWEHRIDDLEKLGL